MKFGFSIYKIQFQFSGDPNKGEMNTLQIRDFQGDGKMLMSLVAQDVVCLRYYEKVIED